MYFDPAGPMAMAPWDVDGSFGGRPPSDPRWTEESGGILAVLCLRDPTCSADWAATAHEVAEDLDGVDWSARVEGLIALTREGADGDPRAELTSQLRDEERTAVQQWVRQATADLRASWSEGDR